MKNQRSVSLSCSGPLLVLLFTLLIAGPPLAAENQEQEPAEWIAFSSGRSGDGDIYAVQPDTGDIILLYGTSAPEGTVRHSPKKGFVYHRYTDDERAMLVGGGRDLFYDPNGDVAPSWSPRYEEIVYAATRGEQDDLFLADTDGKEQRRLTNDPEIDRYPAISPDGKSVVFAKRLESGWDLFILPLRGPDTEARRITHNGIYVGHPAWSPDGTKIAFDTWIDDNSEIAYLDLETKAIHRLTTRAGNDLIPSWSLDGKRIAFGGDPDNAGNWDLWLVDLETLELRRLTKDPASDGGPVFVPASAVKPFLVR